jgi:IS5 family transposase
MGPKRQSPASGELIQQVLTELINLEHPLVKLSALIDWQVFETQWAGFFPAKTGRPATPPRLIAGLLYLQSETPAYATVHG